MIKINQKHYGLIGIDTTERDIVQIFNWQGAMDVVQIERENLPELIAILQAEVTKK